MSKRNSHQPLLYRGPAKGIPTRTLRRKLTDIVSERLQFWMTALYVLGLVIVCLDVFYWRS